MLIRRIQPGETQRCRELFALAFDAPIRGAEEVREDERALHWGAFTDAGEMMSTLSLTPFQSRWGEGWVPMEGVGGVATLPPFRRQGGIRGIFEQALPDMRRRGTVLSYLYPFSTAYYRKFGYELACERNRWSIALRSLPGASMPGSFSLVERGKGLEKELCHLHNAQAARYQLAVRTEPADWPEEDPFATGTYTYLYRCADGKPSAFLTFRTAQTSDGRVMDVSRFVCTDSEGLLALLELLRHHQADYSRAVFCLPTDVRLDGVLPEWSLDSVRCTREQAGMARIVHVEEALRLSPARGSGSCVLEVRDEQIAENCGRFRVSFGKEVNQVERTDAPADLALEISALTRLLIGRVGMRDSLWLPELQPKRNAEALSMLLYEKPSYISVYF